MLGAPAVIASATQVGARVLGMEGKLGVIAPGACAGMLVVDGNPLALSCLLGQGEHIPLVMQNGRCSSTRLAA